MTKTSATEGAGWIVSVFKLGQKTRGRPNLHIINIHEIRNPNPYKINRHNHNEH